MQQVLGGVWSSFVAKAPRGQSPNLVVPHVCCLLPCFFFLCWETASCGNPRSVAEAGGLSLERHCRYCSNLGVRIDMAVTSDWTIFLLKS